MLLRLVASTCAVFAAALLTACSGTPRVQPSSPAAPPAGSAPGAAVPPPGNGAAPACAPCAPCPQCPAAAPVVPPPLAAKPLIEANWRDLPGWGSDELAPALAALLESCKASKSALPAALCADAAKQVGAGNGGLQQFFETRFVPHQVVNADGTREGLITGYYEPLLKGSRKRSKIYAWPIHGVPDDLLTIDLGEHYPELKGARLRGRLEGRKVVPYWSREELTQRDRQMGREALFWLADPIEAFFLQVQGSGRIDLDDGTRVRVAYADQNGHPYRSIGRWLVDKGELKVEQASLDGIRNWARANPSRLDELLNANPSYVFFREVAGANARAGKDIGPAGTLGVPLTPGRSIAVDPRAIPLGAPVWLAATHPGSGKPLQRLMNAQDTGGAIKGGVRADFFWGFGAEAGALAGRMRPSGRLWVLLPRPAP